MTWSLSEIDSLCRKAARGAGFSCGMAEEAGRAARWLASVSLPGPERLAALLAAGPHAPLQMTPHAWQAASGPLCPLAAGTALCDRAQAIAAGGKVTLHAVTAPELLIPFVAGICADTGTQMTLAWPGNRFTFAADIRGAWTATDDAPDVTVSPGAISDLAPLACQLRYDMTAQAASALNALAHHTYAPETEERRLAGAGAGLSDND